MNNQNYGPWSVLYEATGDIHPIGPFNSQEEAQEAATKAQADGEFDIADQQVYLIGPDHLMIGLTEDDVKGVMGNEYDAELAADYILERQELEDFEGLSPFEGSYDA
jgi:hypothetical protein